MIKGFYMNRQYFDIKYPFTAESESNKFIDLNEDVVDQVKSMLTHLIFTPTMQRIRRPEFGTDLIKYIFEQNDGAVGNEILEELQTKVDRYINNITLNDLDVVQYEHGINVVLNYTIKDGNRVYNDKLDVTI